MVEKSEKLLGTQLPGEVEEYCRRIKVPGSSPGGSREFEAGMASARIRKQLLNKTLIKDIKSG